MKGLVKGLFGSDVQMYRRFEDSCQPKDDGSCWIIRATIECPFDQRKRLSWLESFQVSIAVVGAAVNGGVTGLVSGDVQKPQKPGVTGAKPGSHALTQNGSSFSSRFGAWIRRHNYLCLRQAESTRATRPGLIAFLFLQDATAKLEQTPARAIGKDNYSGSLLYDPMNH